MGTLVTLGIISAGAAVILVSAVDNDTHATSSTGRQRKLPKYIILANTRAAEIPIETYHSLNFVIYRSQNKI
ncbi:MAG TPA: hypothetical protein VFV16_09575 [Candidatus Nitrosotalea sp.]|nr:hypothetical protein [Candidatus Nitrosotalea sp.]